MTFNKNVFLLGLFITVILASCGVNSKVNTHNNKEITFMTYNIRHGAPIHKPMDVVELDGIVETIKKADPDIVALQELDSMTQRAPLDEMRELGEKLGMEQVFFKSIDYQGGKYGLGILSKFPIKGTQRIELPMPDKSGEPRILGVVTVEPFPSYEINIGTIHLDLKEQNRLAQVDEIVKFSKDSKLPLIVAGDFNAKLNSDVMNGITQEFILSCTDDCPYTIPSDHPNRTIDHVALNPKAESTLEVGSTKTISSLASDHLPVVVELKHK